MERSDVQPASAVHPEYGYFENDAGIGVIGRGGRLEAAFAAAARATFALVADVDAVDAETLVEFEFSEPDARQALATWLDRLLAEASERKLVFRDFRLERKGAQWYAQAWGAPHRAARPDRLSLKRVSKSPPAIRQTDSRWETRCILE